MKTFFKKITLYVIVLFLLGILSEYLLRSIPNEYKKKAGVYNADAQKIQVLILGSSYGLYDLNPVYFDSYAFNGGHALQSLDMDLKIFSKYEEKLSNLQCLVIPVSFASFFFKLEKSKEAWMIKNYCVYYGIRSTYDPANYFEVLHEPFSVNRTRLFDYYFKHLSNVKVTNTGFDSTYYHTAEDQADRGYTIGEAIRALDITNFDLYAEQKKCLEQIIEKCFRKNIRVILFTPPVYKTFCTPSDTLELNTSIRTCQLMQSGYSNVAYFNLLNDSSFTGNDYFDRSHLNDAGAKKLSLKMNGLIENDKLIRTK